MKQGFVVIVYLLSLTFLAGCRNARISSNAPSASLPTSTPIPTPTVLPSPTLDLSTCTATRCGSGDANSSAVEPVEVKGELLLLQNLPKRRKCADCPENPQLSAAELTAITHVTTSTVDFLHTIVDSQEAYQVAPGIIYLVSANTHHVVIDLEEPGYRVRNIVPTEERGRLITPSYCLSQETLVVINADYYGLNGSNKTEAGRSVFFHKGWAALFELDGQLDIDVIPEQEKFDRVRVSWGGGPIFIWGGRYNYNPKQEWFTPENLHFYETTRLPTISAALSQDRKYLFLSISSGLTLREHAQNIISLGQKWGIKVDKAIRYDGGPSAYLAIRLEDSIVPVLSSIEPKIANCFAIEQENIH